MRTMTLVIGATHRTSVNSGRLLPICPVERMDSGALLRSVANDSFAQNRLFSTTATRVRQPCGHPLVRN
jgi:hypothetical protein